MELLDRLYPYGLLLCRKRNGLLMDTFDVLPGDLLKGTGYYCLGEDITQTICIVDVLCALSDTKYGDFLRQM